MERCISQGEDLKNNEMIWEDQREKMTTGTKSQEQGEDLESEADKVSQMDGDEIGIRG